MISFIKKYVLLVTLLIQFELSYLTVYIHSRVSWNQNKPFFLSNLTSCASLLYTAVSIAHRSPEQSTIFTVMSSPFSVCELTAVQCHSLLVFLL